MHGKIGSPFTYALCCPFNSLGEDVANAIAIGDFLNELEHGLGVAVFEHQPACVLGGDYALLKEFIGKADAVAGADGIEPQLATHVVCHHRRPEVGASCGTRESPDSLIMGALAVNPCVRSVRYRSNLAALEHASVAAYVLLRDGSILQESNLLPPFQFTRTKVTHWKSSDRKTGIVDAHRGTIIAERLEAQPLFEAFHLLFQQLAELCWISQVLLPAGFS